MEFSFPATTRPKLFRSVQWTLVSSCLVGALSSISHCRPPHLAETLASPSSHDAPSPRFPLSSQAISSHSPFVDSTSAQVLNAAMLSKRFSLIPLIFGFGMPPGQACCLLHPHTDDFILHLPRDQTSRPHISTWISQPPLMKYVENRTNASTKIYSSLCLPLLGLKYTRF